MNEPRREAFERQMNPELLEPADEALMRAVDGPGEGGPEVQALRQLGVALREAAAGGADVVEDTMLAVGLVEAAGGGCDVADRVLFAAALQGEIDVSASVLSAVELGEAVASRVDVAEEVMAAVALNEAVRERTDVSASVLRELRRVADDPVGAADEVVARIGPRIVRMPLWAALGGPVVGLMAAAAVALFVLLPGPSLPSHQVVGRVATPVFALAALNLAEVEDIESPANVAVQVMQVVGEPTIILLDDPEAHE